MSGKVGLYELSTGKPVTSLCSFSSPLDEYRAAFVRGEEPFLNYYAIRDGEMRKRSLTRGAFWDLASSAATFLDRQGISKGARIVHGFSANNPYDLIFRLASVMLGSVPVTINWQADDNERLIYKAKLTGASYWSTTRASLAG